MKKHKHIYTINFTEESFILSDILRSKKSYIEKPLSKYEIFKRWESMETSGNRQESFGFLVAIMIVMAAEYYQRKAIQRKTARNTRNIEFNIKRIQDYLKETMQKSDKKGSLKYLKSKPLNSIIKNAFAEIKKEMGFPEKDPWEFSYKVKDEVIVEATDDKCKKYLERYQTDAPRYLNEIQNIEKELNDKHAKDAKDVIKALRETKSREHLSAFSITSDNEETYIYIVNPHNQQIKMESWKFLKLIEDPGIPRLLYDFDEKKYGAPAHKFKFNNLEEGRVEGRFNTDQPSIQVGRFGNNPNQMDESSTFLVDSSYTLCLYMTLKKLKEDKNRFEVLREQAQTEVTNKDIFDNFFKDIR